MFRIKVFPDFQSANSDSNAERRLLRELAAWRERLSVRYVNFSIRDFARGGDGEFHFITYPNRWIQHYSVNFYSKIDPLLGIDYRRIDHLDWEDIYAEGDAKGIMDAFHRHDLGAQGLTYANLLYGKVFGILSISTDHEESDWPHERERLRNKLPDALAAVGRAYRQAYCGGRSKQRQLSRRELECLYWVAYGKTDAEIAKMLNVAKWTITQHMQNVKNKLGTRSRAQATAIAVNEQLIQLDARS